MNNNDTTLFKKSHTLSYNPYENLLELSGNFQKFRHKLFDTFWNLRLEIPVIIWNVKWNGIFVSIWHSVPKTDGKYRTKYDGKCQILTENLYGNVSSLFGNVGK